MVELRNIFVITMWSGGKPAKKWHAYQEPDVLPNGNGVAFQAVDTRLKVCVIGNISVEQFESGREEFDEAVRQAPTNARYEDATKKQKKPGKNLPDQDSPLF